jgi:hypothetical protein
MDSVNLSQVRAFVPRNMRIATTVNKHNLDCVEVALFLAFQLGLDQLGQLVDFLFCLKKAQLAEVNFVP